MTDARHPANDRLLRALKRQPVDRTPVWVMRQAGRYLPEYREVRAKAGSFMDLCRNAELACEVTMQPLRRFDLDAAILFSDILTIPDAMGLGLYFEPGEGPKFERPIRAVNTIDKLAIPDPEDELAYVMNAVSTIRRELNNSVPLIGFSGSPWTLATYMLEGGSSKNYEHSKRLLFGEPEAADRLLDKLADAVAAYLKAQVDHGAQALMIFDTWGGVLTPAHYRRFSRDPMQRVVSKLREQIPADVPITAFSKQIGHRIDDMLAIGTDGLGVDWTLDLATARALTKDQVALQGNLDPSALYAKPEQIRSAVAEVLASYGKGPGHIFNLGHGIHPGVNPDHLAAAIDAVHEFSPQYHQGG